MMDLKLLIASDGTAPLYVLAVAALTAVSLTVEPNLASASQPVLVLTNGTKLSAQMYFGMYLGRIATTIPTLYKRDVIEMSQINEWLDYTPIFSSGSEYEGACKLVDGYLLQHTLLVGRNLSVADIALWLYLAGKF
ncbi:glutamate--tRNA ligase, cytoplasmic, partial [Tanacetum coccineum]